MFGKKIDTNSELNDREEGKSDFDSRDRPVDGEKVRRALSINRPYKVKSPEARKKIIVQKRPQSAQKKPWQN